jgi:hypothetical protein
MQCARSAAGKKSPTLGFVNRLPLVAQVPHHQSVDAELGGSTRPDAGEVKPYQISNTDG